MTSTELAPQTGNQIQNGAVLERILAVIAQAKDIKPASQIEEQPNASVPVCQADSTGRLLKSRKAEMLGEMTELELAATGLVLAKEHLLNRAKAQSDALVDRAKATDLSLQVIGTSVKHATNELTIAQDEETVALKKHDALQGLALEVTADPLKAISSILLEDLKDDQTGDVFTQVVALRDMLSQLVESDGGAPILQVLIAELNNAIVEYNKAKLGRDEKEKALADQRQSETAAVEGAQPLFNDIWDHERAAKRDAKVLEAITRIIAETPKSQKIYALLAMLWFVLSEKKPKQVQEFTEVPAKQPVIQGSIE